MSLDTITPTVVRDALRALRAARPAKASPLLVLFAFDTWRSEAGIEGAREALAPWLRALAQARVRELRGRTEQDDTGPADGDGLAGLRADFRAQGPEREAWGLLWQVYFSDDGRSLLTLAEALGVSRRTLRRRLDRAYVSFAELLRARERAALARADAPGALPRPGNRFVGREAERAALRALLATEPVVTVVGPGGVGKSRLAVEVARDLAPDLREAVVFVDLAGVARDDEVLSTVATALRVRQEPGAGLEESVARAVAEVVALLLMDNAEQVLGGVRELLAAWGEHPRLPRVLVTSRVALEEGEGSRLSLAPLGLPPSEADEASLSEMAHYDAVRLLVDRAKHARPGFRLAAADAARVARVCRRLDGLPLALELAAAQLRGRTLPELEAELGARALEMAGAGEGDRARPEHDSLGAVLAASERLLSARTRTLYGRLAVFHGFFSAAAAVAVCGEDGRPVSEVAAGLDELTAASLLVRHVGVTPRWRMLMTVRDYAARRLARSGQAEGWHARHLAWALQVAEAASEGLQGGEDAARWLEVLDAERAEWLGALRWAMGNGKVDEALRLAQAPWQYWEVRGRLDEGRALLRAVLAMPDAQVRTVSRGKALSALANLSLYRRDTSAAAALYDEARALFAELGDRRGESAALIGRSAVHFVSGELAAARVALERVLALQEGREDARLRAKALNQLGLVCRGEQDMPAAIRCYEACLVIDRERGDRLGMARTLNNLGNLYKQLQELERARPCYEEALEHVRALADRPTEAILLNGLGNLHQALGDYGRAAALHGQAVQLKHRLGDRQWVGHIALSLAEDHARTSPSLALRFLAAYRRRMAEHGLDELQPDTDEALALATQGAPDGEVEGALAAGALLSDEEVVALAQPS